MFIIVHKISNKITASSLSLPKVDESNYRVFEIDDADFSPELVGQILSDYDIMGE